MIFIKILKNTIQTKNTKYIIFDDVIADMLNNKKLSPIVTELFVRGRKLNIINRIQSNIFWYSKIRFCDKK